VQVDIGKCLQFNLSINDCNFNECNLHVQVNEKDMGPWLLTVVYASPRKNERSETWHLIHQLATTTTDPWLVIGDFNEIASSDEKKGECK
jgi:hypothetical protein